MVAWEESAQSDREVPMSSFPIDRSDPLIGKVIDRCVIDRKLEPGDTEGESNYYLAIDTDALNSFKIKILDPAQSENQRAIRRFYRPAQELMRLQHENLISILNMDQEDGHFFIREEYFAGESLGEIIHRDGKSPWKDAARILLQLSSALAHVHSWGIYHQDIRPSNIFIGEQDSVVKLLNFRRRFLMNPSIPGEITEATYFMSPEFTKRGWADESCDLYSLGVLAYYLLTGVRPFEGQSTGEIFNKHLYHTPSSPKIYTADLPQEICYLIDKCLRKDKNERYQSAEEIVNDLQLIIDLYDEEKGESQRRHSRKALQAGLLKKPGGVVNALSGAFSRFFFRESTP